MNYPTITFSSMLRLLIRRWKIWLLCMLLGVALGFGGATLFAGRGTAAPSGSAEKLSEIDLSDVLQNRSYYSSLLSRLEESYQETAAYLNAVTQDASLTDEQQVLLSAQKKLLQGWSAGQYQPLVQTSDQIPVLVPLSLLDEESAHLKAALHSDQLELLSAEAAVDVAKTLRPPVVDNESSLTYYNAILAQTVEYGNLLRQIQTEQEALTLLEKDRDGLSTQIQEFDRDIRAALASLDEFRQTVSEAADTVCRENGLILTAYPNSPETMEPILTHGHVGADYEENFRIIVLFSALVGLGLGMFLAVYKGAEKPRQDETPEHPESD